MYKYLNVRSSVSNFSQYEKNLKSIENLAKSMNVVRTLFSIHFLMLKQHKKTFERIDNLSVRSSVSNFSQ